MPGGDGTGPMGFGPMTGRAAGYCAGYPVPGFMNPIPGRGAWGRGYAPYGAPSGAAPYAPPGYAAPYGAGYGAAPYAPPGYAAAPYSGPYAPAYAGFPGFGFGRGRGWGRGRGRGFGWGRGRGRGWGRGRGFGPVW